MGRRKITLVFGVWGFLFLVAVFGAVLNFPFVKGGRTMYMRADGSADALTEAQQYGDVYAFTSSPSGSQLGIKDGDWIKYDYMVTGAPPGTPLFQWIKTEFLHVWGNTMSHATVRLTMHMLNGTEQKETFTAEFEGWGRNFRVPRISHPCQLHNWRFHLYVGKGWQHNDCRRDQKNLCRGKQNNSLHKLLEG